MISLVREKYHQMLISDGQIQVTNTSKQRTSQEAETTHCAQIQEHWITSARGP